MGSTSTNDNGAPYTVALVAMGPSNKDYLSECIAGAGRFSVADETWAVNAMAGIIEHDKAFIMDDLPYFAKCAREENKYLKGYGDWLHKHPGPIFAQRTYDEFPGAVEYPLQMVLNKLGYAYINNTTVYALAYAIAIGVKHLKIYGMDFSNYKTDTVVEAGRSCFEYWMCFASMRGMKFTIAPSSSLLDTSAGRPLYGYTKQPKISWSKESGFAVEILS